MKMEYLPYIIITVIIMLLALPVYVKVFEYIVAYYNQADWVLVPAIIICALFGTIALTIVVGIIIFIFCVIIALRIEELRKKNLRKKEYK